MIDTYNKLTVGKYLEVKTIIEEDIEEIEKHIRLISVLNDMDEEEVENLDLIEFGKLNQKLIFLTEMPVRKMVATHYKIGGYDLEVVMNMQQLTVAQYIDYQTYLKDTDKYLSELLSVFLIPKGKKYGEGYDIIDVQNAIRDNLTIVDALSMSAFFLLLYQSLTKATVESLTRKMKKMMKKSKNPQEVAKLQEVIANLEDVGVGLHLLTE